MKYAHTVLIALAMTAPLATGCMLDGDEAGPIEDVTANQGLELSSSKDGLCHYKGTRKCTDIDGNETSVNSNFNLVLSAPSGGCAPTYDYYEVIGFGPTEVTCTGILPQIDDGYETSTPIKARASRIDLNP